MTDLGPEVQALIAEGWKRIHQEEMDKLLYGFTAKDAQGNRIDPSTISVAADDPRDGDS